MRKRVLVLGAGFGGLELTTTLSNAFGEAIDIVLIDKGDAFVFGFSKLDVMFGRHIAAAVCHPYSDVVKPGVRFIQTTVRSIDPSAKRVVTDAGEFEADFLIVALGADLDPGATPGLVEGGNEFYSVPGAFALRDVLAQFKSNQMQSQLAYSDNYTFPTTAAPSERLEAFRPESLQIPSSLPHSISLPTFNASSTIGMSVNPAALEFRELDGPINLLRGLISNQEVATVANGSVANTLNTVIDMLISVKESPYFRNSFIQSALFQSVNTALRRSATDLRADPNMADVVEWISNEYLTPRRGSTSSEPGYHYHSTHHTPIKNSIFPGADSPANSRSTYSVCELADLSTISASDFIKLIVATPRAERKVHTRHLSISESGTSGHSEAANAASIWKDGNNCYISLSTLCISDQISALVQQVTDWDNFDVFELHALCGGRTLSVVAAHMFDRLRIYDTFDIKRETFARFITAIEDGYHTVPYHCNIHAADVLHNTFFLVTNPSIASAVTPLALFSSLISAAIHDYNHPGTNNTFQVLTQSEFAVRYNDSCVLENMHCAEAFFTMRRKGCDILNEMPHAMRCEIRSCIINMVLATDMQQHFKQLAELKAEIEKKKSKSLSFDASNPADRHILLTFYYPCS